MRNSRTSQRWEVHFVQLYQLRKGTERQFSFLYHRTQPRIDKCPGQAAWSPCRHLQAKKRCPGHSGHSGHRRFGEGCQPWRRFREPVPCQHPGNGCNSPCAQMFQWWQRGSCGRKRWSGQGQGSGGHGASDQGSWDHRIAPRQGRQAGYYRRRQGSQETCWTTQALQRGLGAREILPYRGTSQRGRGINGQRPLFAYQQAGDVRLQCGWCFCCFRQRIRRCSTWSS